MKQTIATSGTFADFPVIAEYTVPSFSSSVKEASGMAITVAIMAMTASLYISSRSVSDDV